MNWGKGLAIAMAAFIVFILYLAITLMRTKVDLVSDDYYSQELVYQKKLDAISKADSLSPIKTEQTSDQFIVYFPSEKTWDSTKVYLFRPNNKNLDIQFVVKDQQSFIGPMSKLEKGSYELTCEYWFEGANYVQQKNVFIQ